MTRNCHRSSRDRDRRRSSWRTAAQPALRELRTQGGARARSTVGRRASQGDGSWTVRATSGHECDDIPPSIPRPSDLGNGRRSTGTNPAMLLFARILSLLAISAAPTLPGSNMRSSGICGCPPQAGARPCRGWSFVRPSARLGSAAAPTCTGPAPRSRPRRDGRGHGHRPGRSVAELAVTIGRRVVRDAECPTTVEFAAALSCRPPYS